jgi:Protein of unknown function (DUF3822)
MEIAAQLKPAFSVDDPIILQTDLTTCTLILLAGANQFNYGILSKQQKFISLKSYHYQLSHQWKTDLEMIERFLDSDRILYTNFQQIKIGYNNNKSALVPDTFYDSSLKRDYLETLYSLGTEDMVYADELKEYEIHNIYAMDRDVQGYLKKEFRTDKVYHSTTALLKAVNREYAYKKGQNVFIFIQPGQLYLIVRRNDQLLLANSFYYETGADVIYYILNVIQQLGIAKEATNFLVAGEISAESKVYESLHKYLPRVTWLNRLRRFQYSDKFMAYPGNYFYNLFALALCE